MVVLAAAGSALERRLATAGIETAAADRARDALARHAPDVVVTNSGRELRRVIRALGRRASRAPALVLRRGIDRPLRDHPFRRRAWRRLAAIVVNSGATRATVRRSLPWFPDERIRLLHNAVTLDAEPPVPRAAGQPFRVGAVARLVRQKGIGYLLEAVARLPDVELSVEIAGEGKLRRRLEAASRRLGVADRVRFLGHVEALPPLYARLDAVAIPSLYEGFCFVAAEAALAGLPVVASDVSSLPELVEDERTGLLVPPGDSAALATALAALARDPERARALGERARARAAARFAPEPLLDRLVEILDDVVRGATRDPATSRGSSGRSPGPSPRPRA